MGATGSACNCSSDESPADDLDEAAATASAEHNDDKLESSEQSKDIATTTDSALAPHHKPVLRRGFTAPPEFDVFASAYMSEISTVSPDPGSYMSMGSEGTSLSGIYQDDVDQLSLLSSSGMFSGPSKPMLWRSGSDPVRLLDMSEADSKGQAVPTCCQTCKSTSSELFLSPWDQWRYCRWCWIEHPLNTSATPPSKWKHWPLVDLEVTETWRSEDLSVAWLEQELPGWPMDEDSEQSALEGLNAPKQDKSEPTVVSNIPVLTSCNVVGSSAREVQDLDRLGELIHDRYRIIERLGEGCFTEAYLADDVKTKQQVCIKQHRYFGVETLADLVVLDKKLQKVDPKRVNFPRLLDAFFHGVGFTVESLLDGHDLYHKQSQIPGFFSSVGRLRAVARGVLRGLVLLEDAGIVHNDLKPDNIIWVETVTSTGKIATSVRIVDFNCARLIQQGSTHTNWNLKEGGAGCVAYCSPEMALGMPVTHSSDVWGFAVALSELCCSRYSALCLCGQNADYEVSLAQALGLSGLQDGVPTSYLRKSPIDVTKRFTPAHHGVRGHLPLRLNHRGTLEMLRPAGFGVSQILGDDWHNSEYRELGELLEAAFVFQGDLRPTAKQLLQKCSFVAAPKAVAKKKPQK